MAASGFSLRDGAALPTDLGAALSEQLSRLFRRGPAAPADDALLSGPDLAALTPGLSDEIRRG